MKQEKPGEENQLRLSGLALAALAAAWTTPASAHDFWIVPDAHSLSAGDTTTVHFRVGHGAEVDPWNLTWGRTVSLKSYGPEGVTDHQSSIVPQTSNVSGGAKMSSQVPGTHVLAFESYHSFSELAAEQFNDYAEKEGLAAILQDREMKDLQEEPGRETYSRRAKTIVQVGDIPTDNILQPVGQTLEIVPLQNPYEMTEKGQLPVQVFFRGKPLENALVDISDLGAGEEPEQQQRTDENGEVSFDITPDTQWKINVIWGVPAQSGGDPVYETVFSSLTFGY